jgi:hypothetical protein
MVEMRALVLGLFLCGSTARAEPQKLREPDLDSVFESAIGAAGFGISGGKLVLMRKTREGRREQLAFLVGRARVTPLFDVNFGGATAHFRFTF